MAHSFIVVPSHARIWTLICNELGRQGLKLAGIVATAGQLQQTPPFPAAPVYDLWQHNHGVPPAGRHDAAAVTRIYDDLVRRGVERKVFELMGRLERERFLPFYERASLLKLYINYALTILKDRPDFVLFAESPHSAFTYTLLEATRALGIDVIRGNSNPVAPTIYFDRNDQLLPCPVDTRPQWLVDMFEQWFARQDGDYKTATPPYMTQQRNRFRWQRAKNFNKGLSRMLKWLRGWRHPEPPFIELDRIELRRKADASAGYYFARAFDGADTRLREIYESYSSRDWRNGQRPFVYLPMHYQPEMTSNPDGLEYYDQQNLILSLRARLPAEVDLVIREHPSQFYLFDLSLGFRSRNYYRALQAEGVQFSSLDENPFELIDRCAELVTLTGTAGLEACLRNKPVSYIGRAWYRGCPSMRDLTGGLPEQIAVQAQHATDRPAVHDFLHSRVVNAPIGNINPSSIKYFERLCPYTPADDQVELIAGSLVAAVRQ